MIVRPDLFDRARLLVVGQPFPLVEGVLQPPDGVIAVRAEPGTSTVRRGAPDPRGAPCVRARMSRRVLVVAVVLGACGAAVAEPAEGGGQAVASSRISR